eukprot:1203628-Pleurochrysis_carterae.AAC.1
MTPRVKETMASKSDATRADGKDTKGFKEHGFVIEVKCSSTTQSALAGGNRARLTFSINMAAARRGEWDKVCSCGFNGNLIGFCRHAATCVVVVSRFARIDTFLKPWSTVDAWHCRLVGKAELADMVLHTTVSFGLCEYFPRI